LHAIINLAESDKNSKEKLLHIFCVHLGLFEKDRKKQVQILIDLISKNVSESEALIIAGDFNDWKLNATKKLSLELGLKEAFHHINKKHPITFPANFPMLALDRIYYKNIKCLNVNLMKNGIWNKLSDHLAICAEFQI